MQTERAGERLITSRQSAGIQGDTDEILRIGDESLVWTSPLLSTHPY